MLNSHKTLMKKVKQRALIIIVAALSLLSVSLPGAVVIAATPTTVAPQGSLGQGLEISPPLIEQNANPSQSINFDIKLRNVTKELLIAKATVDDFTAAGEDGVAKPLLNPDETSPYSLKAWIGNIDDQRIEPGKQVTMKLTLEVPKDASPGAHYGIIRYTAVPEGIDTTGVSLSASIGTLLLVNVSGAVEENAKIEEFSISQNGKKGTFFEYGPLTFTERITNTGNTFFKPAGDVIIKNTFGKQVATLKVNDPPGNVLPSSTRKFTQNWDKKNLFGRYKAELTVLYGTSNKTLKQTVVFWVIPYKLIAVILLALIILIVLIRFILKRYKKRVIAKSQQSSQQGTNPPAPQQNSQNQPPKQDQNK